MVVLANNFYVLADPEQLLSTVSVVDEEVQRSHDGSFELYIPDEAEGGSLSLLYLAGQALNEEIVPDSNEEQRLYHVTVTSGGLRTHISTDSAATDLLDLPDGTVVPVQSQAGLTDADFWFVDQVFTVTLPGPDVVVDRVDLIQPGLGLTINAIQTASQTTVLFRATTSLHLTDPVDLYLVLHCTTGTLTTPPVRVSPRPTQDSKCAVTVVTENNDLVGLSFQLHNEIFATDGFRDSVLAAMEVHTQYACPVHWFTQPRPAPTQPDGLADVLADTPVRRVNDTLAVLTLARPYQLSHPERLTVLDLLPTTAVRAGRAIPIEGAGQWHLYPKPERLVVDPHNASERLLRDSSSVSVVAVGDTWQRVDDLSPVGRSSLLEHVRSGFSGDLFLGAVLDVGGGGGDSLTVSFSGVSSVLPGEITVSLPLVTPEGLVTRRSGVELADTFFVVTPHVPYALLGTSTLSESEFWDATATLRIDLVEDEFVQDGDALSAAFTSQLAAQLPLGDGARVVVDVTSPTQAVLTFAGCGRSSFSVNRDTVVVFTVPKDALAFSSADVHTPDLTLTAVETSASLHRSGEPFTDVRVESLAPGGGGLRFSVTLVNDAWRDPLDVSLINVHAREDSAAGWNRRVKPGLLITRDSDTVVTVLAPEGGGVALGQTQVEAVDVLCAAGATVNQRFAHCGSFLIQGGEGGVFLQHEHLRACETLRTVAGRVKTFLHELKLNVTGAAEGDAGEEGFVEGDTLQARLRKLDDASVAPFSVCKPPLMNGVSSSVASRTVSDLLLVLSGLGTPTPLPTAPLVVPLVVPTELTTDRVHTVFLARTTDLLVEEYVGGERVGSRSLSGTDTYFVRMRPGRRYVFSGERVQSTEFG